MTTKTVREVGEKTQRTRVSLLRAAEKLFAQRGVDNVSLREISAAAGQGNHAAAAYHFGDKRSLIDAMLHRHSGPVDAMFEPALERLRAEGKESLRALVELLVQPMVRILDDEDGGVDYLLVCGELVNSPSFPITSMHAANGPGAQELAARLMNHIPPIDPMLMPLRMTRTAAMLFYSIASYHRLTAAGLFLPREVFVDDLIETLVALFGAGTGN